MSTKEKVLELFEKNRGCYFSGEEIAASLSVSRSAVWKAVKKLQSEGHTIIGITNKGYCLSGTSDILSVSGIKNNLNTDLKDLNITVLQSVSSTNSYLKERADKGLGDGFVVVSGAQTEGRGRFGRSFYSPEDTGVYTSILLRPENRSVNYGAELTAMAAVAMCESIEKVSGKTARIKWVNDIFVDGRKVCGILTEGAVSLESGLFDYVILGAGVNIYSPKNGFPKEIEETAGNVLDEVDNNVKNRVVSGFLNSFYSFYQSGSKEYIEKYRERNFVIGSKVKLAMGGELSDALVKDIDDNCRLLVELPDGSSKAITSGEISISQK